MLINGNGHHWIKTPIYGCMALCMPHVIFMWGLHLAFQCIDAVYDGFTIYSLHWLHGHIFIMSIVLPLFLTFLSTFICWNVYNEILCPSDSSGHRHNILLMQYISPNPTEIDVKPHGNSKLSEPYLRTSGSTLRALKSELKHVSPKEAVERSSQHKRSLWPQNIWLPHPTWAR